MTDLIQKSTQFVAAHFETISSILIFSVIAVVSFATQLFIHRKQVSLMDFIRHTFPFEGWKTRSSWIDVMFFVTGRIVHKLAGTGDTVLATFLGAGVTAAITWLFPDFKHLHASVLEMVICALVLYMALDFGLWWTHYLEHKVDFLWEVHKVHHSATFLNPMTAVRTHPLSERFEHLGTALTLCVPLGIVMYIYGLTLTDGFLLLSAAELIGSILVMEVLHHSQFPISYGWLDHILISPRMHQAHHSAKYEHWDHNMGVRLAIWDWMAGTQFIPSKDDDLIHGFGVGRGEDYNKRYTTLMGVFVTPIVDSVRVLLGKPVAPLPPPETLVALGLTEPEKPVKKKKADKAADKIAA